MPKHGLLLNCTRKRIRISQRSESRELRNKTTTTKTITSLLLLLFCVCVCVFFTYLQGLLLNCTRKRRKLSQRSELRELLNKTTKKIKGYRMSKNINVEKIKLKR